MLERVLEPEVMDTEEEAAEYAAIDPNEASRLFVDEAIAFSPEARRILDMGTGPAHIPIMIARRLPSAQITAIDLAEHMLIVARRNVAQADLSGRILLERRDVKKTEYSESQFDFVISSAIIHHIPRPVEIFAEIRRFAASGAAVYLKDLARPETSEKLEELVTRYAGKHTSYQRQLFRQSLHAALTPAEILSACAEAGLDKVEVGFCSDRHWALRRTAAKPSLRS